MATAKLNREYALRMYGIGAIMLALSVWSVYDGAVAWPRQNAALDAVRDELTAGCAGITPEQWLASSEENPGSYALKEVFDSHGLQVPKHLVQDLSAISSPPGDDGEARAARAAQAEELFRKPVYSRAKLNGQFAQAAVTLLLAALAVAAAATKRKTVYTVDDEGLSGSGFGGGNIPWDAVASADWTRWDEKGIVTIALKDGRRFKLDGWHFAGVRQIVEVLRSKGL